MFFALRSDLLDDSTYTLTEPHPPAEKGEHMTGSRLGFDIGSNSMKISILQGDKIRMEQIRMPENLVDENNNIVLPNAFIHFLNSQILFRECQISITATMLYAIRMKRTAERRVSP